MDSKIKSITSRLDELCAKRIVLGLQLIPGGISNAWKRRPPSSSVPTERAVYGRDEDKARILEMVLSDDPTADANFRVIPIVGMAGAGKTTLAREVYNDRAVQNFKFDVKAWVCVSDDFDVLSISRALLESITSTTCDLKTLNEVQVKLKIAVDGKRFLLVLDDVWNENYNLWEILKAPFMAGAPNSKIIVTTRHSNVASTMGSIEHYNLKLLSDEDCWSVFAKHAFESRDAGAHQFSELFRKKIVAKCGGLPLAASTLGGLLRARHTEDAWEDILSSKMWDLPQETDILPVLRLSYHYLPSCLKRCFTYCAIFPKDYEFEKNELVFLWVAEGMIQQSMTDKRLEDLGNELFCDLLSRSLFQQSSRDGSEFCGKNCSKPFQSLETLCFSGLPEWEIWDTGNQTGYIEIFPRLVELSISGCPKLSGKLPDHLPALEALVVSYCEELVVSFSSFPLLCKLEIYRCKGLVCSSPIDSKLIKRLTISSCSLDIYGCKGMVYNSPLHSKSLSTPVNISNILEFGKLLKQGFLPAEFLGIGDSQDIRSWRPQFFQGMQFREKAAQGLWIIIAPGEVSTEEKCMSLVSFPEVKFFPINRLNLKIENSGALKSSLEGMIYNCAQLKSLAVEGCDSLEYIARGKLPSSLEWVQILDCKKLQCLLVDEEDASAASSSLSSSSMALKWLVISGCSELTHLSSRSRQLPEELEYLNIEDCPKLESIAESFHGNGRVKMIFISNCGNLKSIPKGQQNLNCLKEIKILNCPSLVSFPEGGLPSTVTNVSIGSCDKLKALPEDMHKLHCLQELEITECPSIESFPEAGFPTNLTLLVIADTKMYKAIIQWGLHRLTSLLRLYIHGGDNAESFPDERMGIILPTSLNRLGISGFPSLKCLSAMGFQSLVSLEFLRISNCPKLKSFPAVGLPHSLLQLHIRGCPLLKKQCKRDKGKDWSKIAHIPYVMIDGKFIFD
ncbi:hypothetical protein CUMW_272350 [Citrus unshiu]|uniref:Uncharacterized protein n=1 Tax=Citrus unshiu TaxID=55188 RepID=A0A2H5MVJ4_CITUN|nr:hypothetical protein CUMW_272350 [Citrus unshiu]